MAASPGVSWPYAEPHERGGGGALTHFDFSAIDEMDPSLSAGQRVAYDREVPFELRVASSARAHDGAPQDVGTLEAIKVKILTLGEDEELSRVQIELTSDADLFFHHVHSMDARAFRAVQDTQKLMVDFAEYPSVLVRMLNACIREPHTHLAVLTLGADGRSHLDVIQNLQYKFVELLSIQFGESPDDVIRQAVTYRYNALRARCALMQARLQDVNGLLKLKSPALLAQLQGGGRPSPPPRAPPSSARGGAHAGSPPATGRGGWRG